MQRGPTRIVTFFLRPEAAIHQHEGSFGSNLLTDKTRRHVLGGTADVDTMHRRVDDFVSRSAGLCGDNVELHVLHNLGDSSSATTTRRRVTYHADAPKARVGQMPVMPTIDVRFWLLQRLLQRQGTAWDCVFAVDLTDVDVLRAPRCDGFGALQLLMASDTCGQSAAAEARDRAKCRARADHRVLTCACARARSTAQAVGTHQGRGRRLQPQLADGT
jgi:hypothetical protein